jgi:hypothetical protein
MDARAASTSASRVGSRWSRLLAVAATTVLALVLAPQPAQAAGPYGNAFVWLDTADAAMCVVPAEHQWNSSSWTPVNEICQDDTGAYSVYLPGQAATAGTVQVNAYGADATYCKVASWAPSGASQRVRVRCYNTSGAAADSQFVLSYANLTGTRNHHLGYVFANQPANASYTPPLNYQYNSTGAANTVTKLAGQVGKYMVRMPGLAGATTGNVQVTAYGPGSEWCNVWNWGPNGTAQHVQVNCFDAAGAPAESRFTVSYVRDGNNIGASVCCSSDGHPTAYALANNPTAASYVPAPSFKFGFSPTNQIHRLSTGRYEVESSWAVGDSAVHVTAAGGSQARCKIESFGSGKAIVRCTTPAGAPIDAIYTYHQVGPFVVG